MTSEKDLKLQIKQKEEEIKSIRDEIRLLHASRSNKRSESYKKKKELLNLSSKHFKETLQKGDIIKVTGSRAGPYKKVLFKTNYSVVVNPYDLRRQREDMSSVTEHGFNKVLSVLKGGKWVSYKEVIPEVNTDAC